MNISLQKLKHLILASKHRQPIRIDDGNFPQPNPEKYQKAGKHRRATVSFSWSFSILGAIEILCPFLIHGSYQSAFQLIDFRSQSYSWDYFNPRLHINQCFSPITLLLAESFMVFHMQRNVCFGRFWKQCSSSTCQTGQCRSNDSLPKSKCRAKETPEGGNIFYGVQNRIGNLQNLSMLFCIHIIT